MKEAGHVLLAAALAALGSGACGMTASPAAAPRCEVVNGDSLPLASGGSAMLCRAIDKAAQARGLKIAFTVRVAVKRSSLSADVRLPDGRLLPTLFVTEMDRAMTSDTFDRFGLAVADHVAGGLRQP